MAHLVQSASSMADAFNQLLAEACRGVETQLAMEGLMGLEGADEGLIQEVQGGDQLHLGLSFLHHLYNALVIALHQCTKDLQ